MVGVADGDVERGPGFRVVIRFGVKVKVPIEMTSNVGLRG